MTFALSCLAFSFNTFFDHHLAGGRASLVAQLVKNLPTVQETWVWFLGWEDSWVWFLSWEDPFSREEDPLEKCYPLQYCGLKSSMDCIAYGVTKSLTQLSAFHSQPKLEWYQLLKLPLFLPLLKLFISSYGLCYFPAAFPFSQKVPFACFYWQSLVVIMYASFCFSSNNFYLTFEENFAW